MKKIILLLLILISKNLLMLSQNDINKIYDTNDKIYSDIYSCPYNSNNDSIDIDTVLEKALLMVYAKWTPKVDIPSRTGYFTKDKTITGLPYSSVKELQKFIGTDVNIYTFLTAVNNPSSLLYSQNVAAGNPCYLGGEYHGVNSRTFYGTVCSSFIAYCFGENHNYTTSNYKNNKVPNYALKKDQSIENLKAGDLLWFPGHIALIGEVERDNNGNIFKIVVLESTGTKVKSTEYNYAKFKKRFTGNGNEKKKAYVYQNKLLKHSTSKPRLDSIKKKVQTVLKKLPLDNHEIYTWFGDRPCIGEWDKLVINFQKGCYNKIIISKNDRIIDTLDISNIDNLIEYKTKEPGIYKACLASKNITSPYYISFEILDTRTKINYNEDGSIEVIFPDNSNPNIWYWVNETGDQLSFPVTVTKESKRSGKMVIKQVQTKKAYLRVIYQGEYGRAINKPIYLFSQF